jgi:hypothetical protein
LGHQHHKNVESIKTLFEGDFSVYRYLKCKENLHEESYKLCLQNFYNFYFYYKFVKYYTKISFIATSINFIKFL